MTTVAARQRTRVWILLKVIFRSSSGNLIPCPGCAKEEEEGRATGIFYFLHFLLLLK